MPGAGCESWHARRDSNARPWSLRPEPNLLVRAIGPMTSDRVRPRPTTTYSVLEQDFGGASWAIPRPGRALEDGVRSQSVNVRTDVDSGFVGPIRDHRSTTQGAGGLAHTTVRNLGLAVAVGEAVEMLHGLPFAPVLVVQRAVFDTGASGLKRHRSPGSR